MAAALSQDLRARLIAAIKAGASCRQAAERFGGAVVNGLVHCACSHHAVHPDLLTLAAGDTPFVTRSRLEQQNGDAG